MKGVVLALAGLVLVSSGAYADHFTNKTITLVVGVPAGGGYDTYARTLAPALKRHIPGVSGVVVQNMPGVAGITAGTWLATQAPRDGTVIGAMHIGALVEPVYEPRGYDPRLYRVLGSADVGHRVCVTAPGSKIKTFDDIARHGILLGTATPLATPGISAALLRNLTGIPAGKMKVVSGYAGTNEMFLAAERGEIDGLCGIDWSSLRTIRPKWVKDGSVHVLVQMGPTYGVSLPGWGKVVPDIRSLIDTNARAVFEFIAIEQLLYRPYVLPPQVGDAVVGMLQAAFMAALQDKEFLAEASRKRLTTEPVGPQKMRSALDRLYTAPPDLIRRAKDARQL